MNCCNLQGEVEVEVEDLKLGLVLTNALYPIYKYDAVIRCTVQYTHIPNPSSTNTCMYYMFTAKEYQNKAI